MSEKTETVTQYKKVKEVFKDYNAKANIMEAKIAGLNVIKRTNTLGIALESDEYIEVKEIWYLEKFLMERFAFKSIDTHVKYLENTIIKSVKDEWVNIICYMAHKFPLMRPMLLMKSNVEISDDTITARMHIKGADFLRMKKTDVELHNVIKKLFGKEYKIELIEEINKDDELKYEEHIKEMEEKAIEQSHINLLASEEKNEKIENENIPNIPLPNDEDIPLDILENGSNESIENNIESKPLNYIVGKASRAKEKFIKIKEISPSNEKITIEGKVLSVDIKETKTGKGLIIMDVYDETSTITVKTFSKDIKTGEVLVSEIKKPKSIRITGIASLDPYSNDVTILANTIAKTEKEYLDPVKQETQYDLNSPLIYGKSVNIKAPLVQIQNLTAEDGDVCINGEITFLGETRELKSGKTLFPFAVYDGTNTITCKAFLPKDIAKPIMKRMNIGNAVKVEGNAQMDSFSDELTILANTIVESEGLKKDTRQDNAKVKRVELHMHTKMSQMDAVTSAEDLIKRAMKWGMKSIAITDHGSVQAFPEAYHLVGVDNPDIKIIYGVEAYLVPDNTKSIYDDKGQDIDTTYCVLDLETTGISAISEKITEVRNYES